MYFPSCEYDIGITMLRNNLSKQIMFEWNKGSFWYKQLRHCVGIKWRQWQILWRYCDCINFVNKRNFFIFKVQNKQKIIYWSYNFKINKFKHSRCLQLFLISSLPKFVTYINGQQTICTMNKCTHTRFIICSLQQQTYMTECLTIL